MTEHVSPHYIIIKFYIHQLSLVSIAVLFSSHILAFPISASPLRLLTSAFKHRLFFSLLHRPYAGMSSLAAAGLLSRQLKQMQTDTDIPGISCGLVGENVFEWDVMLMISDECRYYGGEQPFFFSNYSVQPFSKSYNDSLPSQVDSFAPISLFLPNIHISRPR